MAGEVVWITGASSGIGREVALRLAREGHRVAASARNAEQLGTLAVACETSAGSITAFPLDVRDAGAASETFKAIEAALGPVERAIFGAASYHQVEAADFRAEDFARDVQVNVLGVANCLEPVMRAMIERRRGRLAIISSVAGYRGLPSAAYYGATKAALINLAEALKFDLDRYGVRIQLIDPGFVRTPMTAKNRFAMPFLLEPEDAAARIVRGLSGSGFEITFPKRFTYLLKVLRCLPYRVYFPLVARGTRR